MATKFKDTKRFILFEDAINHCRWKKVLYNLLPEINVSFYKDSKFEDIIIDIHRICNPHKGIGMLTIYDITSSICNIHNITIDKVYIIGNGPKRAIKLLNIKTKIHKINNQIRINYVEIEDIVRSFDENHLELENDIRHSKDGDIFETFICNWQKTK